MHGRVVALLCGGGDLAQRHVGSTFGDQPLGGVQDLPAGVPPVGPLGTPIELMRLGPQIRAMFDTLVPAAYR